MAALILPPAALSAHVAIVGKTGAGKTFAAKGFVETLLRAAQRVCVIDPTGAWWGLRSSADGKKRGFSVAIFGGEHADLPISARSGPALAQIIATRNLPCVIDTSELLIGERHRFVEEFAAELYRHNRLPLHLVIDEADECAPQNPLPETKRMLHQIDRIVRRGRIKGFRVMMITQRPAVLHKNILTQANTLIAMRLTAPQDRKAIEAWIMGNGDLAAGKEVLNSLAQLQRGEGWVWAPEQGVLRKARFPAITTFDSSRAPEDGDSIAPTMLAEVDLEVMREALADAENEAAANDPKKLRARIAELEKAAKQAPVISPAKTHDFRDLYRKALAAEKTLRDLGDWLNGGAGRLNSARALFDEIIVEARRLMIGAPVGDGERPQAQPIMPRQANSSNGSGGSLPIGERSILTALAQYPEGSQRERLTILTGYKRSTRDAYLQRLRERGLIEPRGALLFATPEGIAALGRDFDPLPTGSALREYWIDRLPEGERRTLEVCVAAYPSAVERGVIDQATNYKRSSRDAYIQRLKTRQLVTVERNGVRASDELFE